MLLCHKSKVGMRFLCLLWLEIVVFVDIDPTRSDPKTLVVSGMMGIGVKQLWIRS